MGCIVSVDGSHIKGTSGRVRLGVVKFFLPKWGRFFIHMFSSEEGTTEFVSMPKAVKEVNSWLIKGQHAGVDMSRLEQERFWVGDADLSKVTLMCDEEIWFRSEEKNSSSPSPDGNKGWSQCMECEYLIDEDEELVACNRCKAPYHGDCLFEFEKKQGREYDPPSLDEEAKKYMSAARKWTMRRSSSRSANRNVVYVDEDESSEEKKSAEEVENVMAEFTCKNCKECRYCCARIMEEIIPSGSNLLPIEPFVICTKCNSAAHGHCVFPPVPKLHSSVQWVCDDCRECNSCGRITYLSTGTACLPSSITDWALPSFDQCKQCFAGLDKGEYCPVCMRAWSVDWGGDMVQCDVCEFWVHISCDDLGSVNLKKLGGSDVKYNCPICRDPTDVHRRRRVVDLLRAIDKVALFSEPVSASFMPVYLKVIKNPMDLSRMGRKVYGNNFDFIKDFELIVDNAKIFNMPNSPAYRLAEQFHKQGKLLIEKYLLIDRKGAVKIEGLLSLETGEGDEGEKVVLPEKRSSKNWKTAGGNGGPRKKQMMSYEHALDIIKRGSGSSSGSSLSKNNRLAAGGGGIIISPYKRKLSTAGGALLSPTSPKSASPRLLSLFPKEQDKQEMSLSELEETAKKIFGFTANFFLQENFSIISSTEPRDYRKRDMFVKADFSRLLKSIGLSSQEIARDIRWCLYDVCSHCGSFGESWNFVECQDCGDCFHWFCCGLIANPNESITQKQDNPLEHKLVSQQQQHFKCKACCRPRGEPGHDNNCCLCGTYILDEEGVDQEEKNDMPRFRLNFSPETNVETIIEGSRICASCVTSQALNFFKASTCKACNCLINPNVASCFFRAMPPKDEQDTTVCAAASTGRPSPLVHCVACGDTWHTRCMPEFSDLTSTDVLGVYVCSACSSSSGERAEESAAEAQVLAKMGNCLKNFRPRAYREIQTDFVLEILKCLGVLQTSSSPPVDVSDIVNIFSSTSDESDSIAATWRKLSEQEKRWIEWGMRNKDSLVGVGGEQGRKKSPNHPEVVLLTGGGGIKSKRMDDEDLLFVKRLHSAFSLVKSLLSENLQHPVQDDAPPPQLTESALAITNSFHRELLFSGAEAGSRLLQIWLKKYIAGGFIGPGVGASRIGGVFHIPDQIVPVWEDRKCSLCFKLGDSLVEGCLLPFSSMKWVHAECLAWSLPSGSTSPSIVEWRHARPVLNSVEALGVRKNTAFKESEIHNLVEASEGIFCTVCSKKGASVFCQSCHQMGGAFHLSCAVSVNNGTSSIRVLMDTRCRMLTCGKCLYRHPENEKYFLSNFSAQLQSVKASQSILNDIWTQRHLNPVVVVGQPVSPPSASSSIPGCVFREGPLSIVCPGNFSGIYDGSSQIIPRGFAAVRLFWILDLTLKKRDEEAGISVLFPHSGGVPPQLKKRRRGAYLCRISEDGSFFSIQVIGGRVVAVGTSLSEVWKEFKHMIGVKLPNELSGEWFFGLKSGFMQTYLQSVAMKSVKRQAGINREKWLYNPQLRLYVTKALGLKSELKTVSSIRRNLPWEGIDRFKAKINQLESLGRKLLPQGEGENQTLLDPALAIPEITSGFNIHIAEDQAITKPSRAKAAEVSIVFMDSGLKYKLRNAIADINLLTVKRSKIHNYGLFAKNAFSKGDMVVEYQGEILRQTIADEREKKSEREGDGIGGSCYMFKLDDDYVVDATVKGNCARFINHSCCPNCSCKMIEDDNRQKHIMIIAKRDILPGEEITYDYQFAVESEKLACLCGAPNCLGRLN